MADVENQYDWAEKKGFHPQLIKSMIVGGLVTPLVLTILVASVLSKIFPSTPPSTLLSIAFVAIMPVGVGLGYLVGLGMTKQRLAWVRWAAEKGWSYEAKPPHPGADVLDHVDQLRSSTVYWRHANRRNLIGRRTEVGGACIMTSSSIAKQQLHDDNQSQKQANHTRSGLCVDLVMDTGTSCPDMTIHPHAVTDRLPIPHGLATVAFELDAFNQAWTVRADDAKAAYDRIDQRTIDFLLQHGGRYVLEFVGGLLVVQYWISEAERMNFQRQPRGHYDRVMGFTKSFTQAVPDDLVPPLDLDSLR